jgi:lambda family phage minor tail protein L
VLGCTLYRVRTYARFLDNGSEPDPTAFFGPDIFRVERKAVDNPVIIEFELSASIDQEGKKLPGRQVIRDTCLWRYRIWNATTGEFDYAKAQCPYTGTSYFDASDRPVDNASEDVPSRRLRCCELRFGKKNPLPFGGFPGVARVRQ